jgi:spore germination protein
VPALAGHVDRFTLMAYDQHGPWAADDPGPVGDLRWQADSLDALLELVGPEQVHLGVAGYGYRWLGPDGSAAVSTGQARQRVADQGGEALFDEDAGEWTATLGDGTVLWWADRRSLALRVALARDRDLAGVSVWSLAVADPIEPADVDDDAETASTE